MLSQAVRFGRLARHAFRYGARRIKERAVVTLEPNERSCGRVLLSYNLTPFQDQRLSHDHTNYWESRQIAQTYLDLGLTVDAIWFHNHSFLPKRPYDVLVDIRWNMQRLAPRLSTDCVKIAHMDTAHILFHSTAEMKRLLALQARRGITLRPRRFELPNHALEFADYVTVLGNDFTLGTYAYAEKPTFRLPISSPILYERPAHKEFDTCRKQFLWFNSSGMVHKGLDLVLEAFAQMPDFHLTVCGPVSDEPDFAAAYHEELNTMPNIELRGWTDIASDSFEKLTQECIGFVSVSCSEGTSGAAVTCLHAGLIPIVSRETGIDIDSSFGFQLTQNTVEEIMSSVGHLADLPVDHLEELSHNAWRFARKNHTRERFATEYRQVATEILTRTGKLDNAES